ncbi:MAG: glycerol-3-phosphate dehydrogenase [Hyphomicrobiales bacterium]|nr:glycerol-3-phosphate dehydrogenase [Hyphomicrobiales bacterium]
MAEFDIAIVGGGINGAGIARDAAGRGLRVLLVEQNDLGSGTSSAATKLIHGGLRYLEHGWLRLVREALTEREILLRMAPHLIRPLRFVLPVEPGMRPRWMLRLGLFVYDHLGGRRLLPATRSVDLDNDPLGAPLKPRYRDGFEYSDCFVDDARLVVLNAMDAADRGAVIRTRTRCVRVERGTHWTLVLEVRGRRDVATARVLVNATGPWVGAFSTAVLGRPPSRPVRLVAGSHVVLPRLYEHDRAYIFQVSDGRVVFALPYERDFTLLGTTDRAYAGDPGAVAASAEEVGYLCAVASDRFRQTVTAADVVWSFAGVRPLHGGAAEKPQDVPRDHLLDLDRAAGEAPLLTVFGGKISTYRRLAEDALEMLAPVLGERPRWTRGAALPGGDFDVDGLERLIAGLRRSYPFVAEAHARRLAQAYGTRVAQVIGAARSPADLGPRFGGDLTAVEVRYLMQREWAQSPDDVLWRRTKLGLRASREDRSRLASFMTGSLGDGTSSARNH